MIWNKVKNVFSGNSEYHLSGTKIKVIKSYNRLYGDSSWFIVYGEVTPSNRNSGPFKSLSEAKTEAEAYVEKSAHGRFVK